MALVAASVIAAGLVAGCGDEEEDDGRSETAPAITGEAIEQSPDQAEAEVRELLDTLYSSDKEARCEAFGSQAYAAAGTDEQACKEAQSGSADVKYETDSIDVDPENGTAEAKVGVGAETVTFRFSVEDGEWKIQSPSAFFL